MKLSLISGRKEFHWREDKNMLQKPEWYLLDPLHVSILYFVIAQWLKDPGPRSEKRTLLCDMACFLLITPLAAISGWLCLRGAQDHLQLKSRLEAVGLIALTIALFTIYILWTLVTKPDLYSRGSWRCWQQVNVFLSRARLIFVMALASYMTLEDKWDLRRVIHNKECAH